MPTGLTEPYSLRLETVTILLEEDENADHTERQSTAFGLPHPMSNEDIQLLKDLARALMTRAAAFLAAAVCAVKILHDAEFEREGAAVKPTTQTSCTVSCLGAVIEKCPGLMAEAQTFIDGLYAQNSTPTKARPKLVVAPESSLTGVAVAATLARLENKAEEVDGKVAPRKEAEATSSTKDSERPVIDSGTESPSKSNDEQYSSTKSRQWWVLAYWYLKSCFKEA